MPRLPTRALRVGIMGTAATALLLTVFSAPTVEITAGQGGVGTGATVKIFGTHDVSQVFETPGRYLTALEIAVVPPQDLSTVVEFSLENPERSETLLTLRGPVGQFLTSPDTLRFKLPAHRVRGTDERRLAFSLRAPGAAPTQAITVRFDPTDKSYPAGQRIVDGRPVPGALALTLLRRASRWESLRPQLLTGRAGQVIAGIVAVALGALLALDASDRGTPARRRRVVLGGLLLALLYLFPFFAHLGFWAPDESDWAEASATVAAMRQTVAVGQIPQWNPFLCGGSPALANPQTYLLPLALPLSFLVSDVVAIKVEMVFVIALGVMGMFWLCGILGLTGAPRLLASSVFMFSGFTTTHLANGQVLWLTLAFVPWAVGAFWKSLLRLWWVVPAAAVITLIFVEGRVYLVAYLALFLAFLAVALALRDRTLRPLVSLLAIAVLTVAFSAWKLLPALDFLAQTKESLPNTNGLPLRALPVAFLGRNLTPNVDVSFGTDSLPRHEIAAYVGIVPLALALAALRRRTVREALPFLVTGGVFLLFAMQGGTAELLEYVPLARELRNPSRMTSMVVFSLALLAVLGLTGMRERLQRSRLPRLASLVPAFIAAVVLADLLSLSWANFAGLFRVSPQVVADFGPGFFQTKLPERQPSNGYPTVAAGKGAKDFCPVVLRAYRPVRAVRAREDPGYRGEVYTVGAARIFDVTITPNVVTARIEAKSADTVVVNQNFARGWTASPHPTRNEGGLIGVDVPAGSSKLTLRYRTPYLRPGAAISFATVLVLGVLWMRQRRRRST